MTTFTVWKYDDPKGAEHAFDAIKYAAADDLVKIVDHAIVTWPQGAAKPDTHHAHDRTWRAPAGAPSGAWCWAACSSSR